MLRVGQAFYAAGDWVAASAGFGGARGLRPRGAEREAWRAGFSDMVKPVELREPGGLRALLFEDDLGLLGGLLFLAEGAGYVAERRGRREQGPNSQRGRSPWA